MSNGSIPTPANVTDEQAAACALVGITAHLGLFREAKLEVGRIDFRQRRQRRRRLDGRADGQNRRRSRHRHGRQRRKSRRPEKARARTSAVNYKTDDIAAAVKTFAPGGVNVYWETVREPDFDKIVSYLARARPHHPHGRPRCTPAVSRGPILRQGLLAPRLRDVQSHRRASSGPVPTTSTIGWPTASSKPTSAACCRWLEAAAAHKLQEENTLQKAGTLAGKIVLKP